MKHICKLPRIVEDTDRWGRPMGTYYVNFRCGYVDQTCYNELVEFESYKCEDDHIKEQVATMTGHGMLDLSQIKAPKLQRLLARSKHQLWEFDMHARREGPDYVRSYAILGERSLHVMTKTILAKVKFMEVVVWFMNLRSKLVKSRAYR